MGNFGTRLFHDQIVVIVFKLFFFPLEFFINGTVLSLNSVNSANSGSLIQEVAGLSPFTVMTHIYRPQTKFGAR